MAISVYDGQHSAEAQKVPDRRQGERGLALFLLLASVFQIAGAAVPEILHLGVSVSMRSLQTQHPLVPEGIAFSIWSLIYLTGVIAAIWALRSPDRAGRFGFALMCLSLIFWLNGAWALWVPFRGFDALSMLMIILSLGAGIAALMRLRAQVMTVHEVLCLGLPLALVTGWLSAAMPLNITSAMVETGFAAFDPRVPVNSALVLGLLVLLAMTVIWLTRNRLYALPVIWALFWVVSAAVTRDHLPLMAALGGIGIGFILVEVGLLSLRRKAKGPAPV